MIGTHAGFDRRVLSALDASPSRIPVVLGGCGSGRSSLLAHLSEWAGRSAYLIDVERCATTPERFTDAVFASAPMTWHGRDAVSTSARDAFDRFLAFLASARGPAGEPCLFLLDEAFELRTFENFPGLRQVLHDLLEAIAVSENRFVLTSRYTARAHRLLREASSRYEVMHIAPLGVPEVVDHLAPAFNHYEQMATADRDFLGRAVHALTDGRPVYVQALAGAVASQGAGPADPVAALASLLVRGGALDAWCRFRYELRLHRARGYGALKAILDILAEEEPLNLTEISLRLHRTPGSTKDYLSWLEDVDLVTVRQKRYTFSDPILRLWVGLHCRPVAPTEEAVAREVQRFALARIPEPSMAYAATGTDAARDDRRNWGIIEID